MYIREEDLFINDGKNTLAMWPRPGGVEGLNRSVNERCYTTINDTSEVQL